MSRPGKTVVVRIHSDVAQLAEKLAAAFGQSTPDFISEILRPRLDSLRKDAAKRIIESPLDAAKHPQQSKRTKRRRKPD